MKRLLALCLTFLLLTGCAGENRELGRVMEVRQALQKSNGCSFLAEITADYKDEVYEFELECSTDNQGNLTFYVVSPETIQGISGRIDEEGGKLTFDDTVLSFPMLADDLITPVSAPWVFVKTLRSGYITSAGKDGEDIHAVINDSYEEQALQLDIWFDTENKPKRCEILWQGRRILSMNVDNYILI